MEAFLQTGQKVDLVATHWWSAATAAATALKEKGYPGKVYIVGLEFAKELIPFIKDGTLDMTTNYGIADTGFKAVEAAAKYLKGEKIPRTIEVIPYMVTKDNVDSIVPEL
jgi:ribose transport system substrate-binding protein